MSLMENLFSRSPFTPLQTHMEKVAECVNKLDELYAAFVKNDSKLILKITDEISDLEEHNEKMIEYFENFENLEEDDKMDLLMEFREMDESNRDELIERFSSDEKNEVFEHLVDM